MIDSVLKKSSRKREASFVSLNLIVIYFLLVLLDIYTTLLTDENLTYEGNIITLFFVDNKIEFIIYVLSIAFASISLVIIADKLIQKRNSGTIPDSKKPIRNHFSFLIFVLFYTHIFSLLWVIPNNTLHFIYTKNYVNCLLFDLSKTYVGLCSDSFPFYQITIQVLALVISFVFVNYKSNKIKLQ